MSAKPKRKLKNFLLDWKFQLKYTLAVVLVTSAISLVLGIFLYNTQQEVFSANRENSQLLTLDDPEINQAIQAELEKADAAIEVRNRTLILTLIAAFGGLVLLLTLLGIVATHKIAGPAYAMKMIISMIADGKHPHVRKLRKGDELVEVSKELKRMADNLRQRDEEELQGLKELKENLKSAQNNIPDQSMAWLEELISDKEQRLEKS